EIGSQSVPLAEELTLAMAEMAYLQDRRLAYENLGLRAVALAQAEPKQPAAAPTKVASAKRVVQPAEPVLASSAPDLTKTTLEPTAAPEPAAGGQVASRIAASFDSFGSAAFASAGDSHQLGLASAYSSFR
ncbi:hypothetical protein ACIKTA_15225, partial [Hansschlegelia beijingensis]